VSPDGQRFLIPRLEPNTLTVFDRGGRARTLVRDSYETPVFSPDGTRVAVVKGRRDVWVVDVATGHGDWSPDGRFPIYYSTQPGGNRLFALPVTGEPKPVQIMRSDDPILGARLSPARGFLATASQTANSKPHLCGMVA
jgi:hypothetical protein